MGRRQPFLADFHLHSTFSDGRLSIPEIVDLFGTLGFGAIAITDHVAEANTLIGKAAVLLNQVLTQATFPLYQAILENEKQRAWDQYRMVLIPGVELSKNTVSNSRSAHILGLGIQEFLAADGEPEQLCRKLRDQGAVTVAAHPVHSGKVEKQTYYLWDRRDELTTAFDAWEVASGVRLFPEVLSTRLPKIANSDMHHPRQLSSWKTELNCERHEGAILQAIRQQQVAFRYFCENNSSK